MTLELAPALVGCLARIAVALEWIAEQSGPVRFTSSPSQRTAVRPASEETQRAAHTAGDSKLAAELRSMKTELAEIKELLTAEKGEVIKEAYKVPEVVKRTKLTAYTIRQACNKGRIRGAYKGKDHQWRIPHAALVEIEKNGLPPE